MFLFQTNSSAKGAYIKYLGGWGQITKEVDIHNNIQKIIS